MFPYEPVEVGLVNVWVETDRLLEIVYCGLFHVHAKIDTPPIQVEMLLGWLVLDAK